MLNIVKSEFLKLKRTFARKLIWFMPLITLILSFVLMGGKLFQYGAYNWWYVTLFPGSITIFCTSLIQKDAKMKYRSILSFSIEPSKIWLGKIFTGLFLIFLSCFAFFVGVTLGGYVIGEDISIYASALGSLVLFITFAWQVPFCMFLSLKIGIFGTLIVNILANIVSIIFAVEDVLWLIPYAIPSRLMVPILKLNPNGVPLSDNDVLLNSNVILPGLLVSVIVCIILTLITTKYFSKQEAK